MAELDPRLYTVAWIAPLEIEAQAALHMLDNRHPGRFRMERGDDYVFQAGDACGHNIIIATLPAGELYGTGSAAALANQVKKFFPNLWFGLLVGVAAGLPNLSRRPPRDIRLGDVLVGLPIGDNAGLIPYDLGKETGNDGFQLLRAGHGLARTETVVRSAIGSIKLLAPNDADEILRHYKMIENKEHSSGTFDDPGQERDMLYQVGERGIESLVYREQRPASKRTRVWYGSIGSGDKLMKNAQKRNQLRDKYDLIGLEMEAAGTMDRIPVGVVRGVCDYGDEHKNKEWQPYAAAMAASYARAILSKIGPMTMSQETNPRFSVKRNFDKGNFVPTSGEERNKRLCYEDRAPQDGSSENTSPENFSPRTLISSPNCPTRGHRGSRDDGTTTAKEQPVTEAVDTMDATIKQSLIEQLYFDKIDERYMNLTAAQGKTCLWFLEKPEYLSWNDSSRQPEHGGFLWVKGNPGTGKSTLMKFLFEKAKADARTDSSKIILSFFFLARGTIEEKSTIGLYRSLLHQLFEKVPGTQNSLEWMTTNGAKVLQRNGWSEQALKQTLAYALQTLSSRSLMIFVDALDECNQDQVAEMVRFFEELCDSARDWKVLLQVCFSSRHYPTVVIEKGIEVTLENEIGHTQDIQQYIKTGLRLGRTKQADSLRSEILEKSSGIFLWVVLVLEIINREYPRTSVSIKQIRDRLREIPPKLHDLFEMVLTRDGENLDRLHLCLRWILFAARPLKPQELYFAVQFGQDRGSSGFWDQTDVEIDEMKSFVSNSSKGLAEVTRNKAPQVQFIHESVRDFLQEKYETQWSEAPGGFVGHSHILLRDCCSAQLERLTPEAIGINDPLPKASAMTELREKVTSKYPFLEYATLNVLHHADRAQQDDIHQENFLVNFPLQRWIFLHNTMAVGPIQQYTKSVSLLYILAERNLAHLIRIHPKAASFFEIEEGDEHYGTPIFAALATGSREAVWAFLRKQAETMPSDSPFHKLLEEYCQDRTKWTRRGMGFDFCRQEGMAYNLAREDDALLASFILTKGRDPISLVVGYDSVLSLASKRGFALAVKYILEQGASHPDYDTCLGSSLYEAASHGHEAVVKLLLEHNAAPNEGRYGWSPLYAAAERGYGAIVKLLLEHSAEPNGGHLGSSPLYAAASHGHEAVVKLLLEHSAEPNGGHLDSSPLDAAASHGHEAVVKLLLEHNAEPNGGRSGTLPLYTAARHGYKAIAKLLLEHNANPDMDVLGWSPLYAAACMRDEAFVKLLLEHDAKPHLGYYDTLPLYAAANYGHETIVKLLLSSAYLHYRYEDEAIGAILDVAAARGHKGIVELLVSTEGLWKHAASTFAGNALVSAAFRGHGVIVEYLLAKGVAELNYTDQSGRCALSYAAAGGHVSVVKLLLTEGGIDLNHQDKGGMTPLAEAAMFGHTTTVHLLLSQEGIDLNRADISGQTPLSRAVDNGRDAIVKLLLDKGASI